jgi:hypothetical protein
MLHKIFSQRTSLLAGRQALLMRTAMPVSLNTRSFVTGDVKKLDEKEKGDEQIFFKRQEGKL